MRILITGADQPLGAALVRALRSEHDLILVGASPNAPTGAEGLPYSNADLREPDQVEPLVSGVQAIAHLAHHMRPATPDAAAEKEVLDLAGRGAYVLLHAALKAGVVRVVLASRLELMSAYPENYLVDPNWRPRPKPDAASLAPFVAELTVREFVRAEELVAV
ncbi:MAG: NAD(P)-dependent oxidoreductase, partial [Armatimonadetes bacterium]|nr:NAD(P)-dependent oxidoreductase [Armatimonadota bacterium]